MKNTSLCFFGQCQRKARPAWGQSPQNSKTQFSLLSGTDRPSGVRTVPINSECNIIDVATLENCSLENFPCRDVYYVVRSAKQKKDNNLVVWIATKELFKRLNYVHFHIFVGRTLKLARLAQPAKKQKRVNFLAFSSPLFIYSKSDTTIIWCCGSLRTFVLFCYLWVYISRETLWKYIKNRYHNTG